MIKRKAGFESIAVKPLTIAPPMWAIYLMQ